MGKLATPLPTYKPFILRALIEIDGPATVFMLEDMFPDISPRALRANIQRLVAEADIEERDFKKEGINPLEYISSNNTIPKVFYVVTPRGLNKYNYYKKKGVYNITFEELREKWRELHQHKLEMARKKE